MNSTTGMSVVLYLEDNRRLRESVQDYLTGFGYRVVSFSCSRELLDAAPHVLAHPTARTIGLFDMRLSEETSGLGVFHQLRKFTSIPVIFLSGESRVNEAIDAMKAGAFDFLLKPFELDALLACIERCFREMGAVVDDALGGASANINMFSVLTPRESEVLRLVLAGYKGREVASTLSITERTVKMHRSNVMKKVNARSLAQLASLYQQYLQSCPSFKRP